MSIQPLIDLARTRGGLSTDDVLAAVLPLLREVSRLHAEGLTAPLRGPDGITVDDLHRLHVDAASARPPITAPAALAAVQHLQPSAVEVVARSQESVDPGATGRAAATRRSLDLLEPGEPVTRPVLVAGWQTWEHVVGHHDQLTDIASLGELIGALAAGLDLALVEDAERLATHRSDLLRLAPRLHPVVSQVATAMIEPDRRRRAQDLAEVTERLETYRDQPVDFDLADLLDADGPGARAGVHGNVDGGRGDRRGTVLVALRDRLFDLSRRNRLLYFRPMASTLDLTEASVPLLLDPRNVRAEQLYTWQPRVAKALLSGRPVPLGSVLRWEDAPYAASVLDGLISQARRDRSEYGQAQLRLVVAFLRWHDLKGDRDERISSPLLLLPVTLSKQRGVRDSYLLQASGSVGTVNPALRRHLNQLYGLELPESVDLAAPGDPVAELHAELARQIARTEPAVTLTLQQRPRIELVHQRALLRAQAFARRAERGLLSFGARLYAYSYRRRDYSPLGLQLFHDRVSYRPAPLGLAFGEQPAPRPAGVAPSVSAGASAPSLSSRPSEAAEHSAQTYLLDRGGQGNPYAWDVDLCALTLASVNYRTMSLVRDYDALAGSDLSCPPFEELISTAPRQLLPADQPGLPVGDRYVVVPADASQIAALARARQGGSFVIQGPPGTGKSQTITNLIADYVAAGRRVLFVCQKRAAIDVVHARLRGQGLGELSCLIHDSQADKKAFVLGLAATYQAWTETPDAAGAAEQQRTDVAGAIGAQLEQVRRYESALTATTGAAAGPSARELLERLVQLRDRRWDGAADPSVRGLLPSAATWWAARPVIARVSSGLAGSGRVLARSPLRYLAPGVLSAARPDAEAAVRARIAIEALDRVDLLLGPMTAGLPQLAADRLPLPAIEALVQVGALLAPLADRGRASALLAGSSSAESLRAGAATLAAARQAADRAVSEATGWREPLEPADALAALDVARRREGSLLRWFDGSWRSVRAAVRQRFDPAGRVVPPTVTQALELLVRSQQCHAERSRLEQAADDAWGYRDLPELVDRLDAVRSGPPERAALAGVIASAPDAGPAHALAAVAGRVQAAQQAVADVLVDTADLPLPALRAVLAAVADPATAGTVRALAPSLLELGAHPPVASALRRLDAEPEQLEYAVAADGLDDLVSRLPALAGFDGEQLAAAVRQAQSLLPRLYAADAAVIVARVRTSFLAGVAHSTRSVTGMTSDDRARKQVWSTGRRELEHEFGKVRAYRSIRELASGAPGAVVAAMRPVWLMSPTSVSDTLPLDPSLFDVVIYDEASQIPLEEAVPAMHRARQVIVVGDQMQLPPTQYFTVRGGEAAAARGAEAVSGASLPDVSPSGAVDPDPEQDDELEVGIVLDADSLLATCAVRLPSTMLTWHYRSRYEALIGFSNAAFYDGRLATVPDRTVVPPDRPGIEVDVTAADAAGGDAEAVPAAEVEAGLAALLDRSISVHRMRGAVYRRRTNPGEAAYIAALVRALLTRDGERLTLGVVAFSQAQQSAIEAALDHLAERDPAFARRYEEELAREDDDQFVGLFVKNLENVQGDERDVILMSVCYAPGQNGRMVMNFGPINQRGGEKRLNVIFSRARRHMGIVSTIEADAVTNVYNDGANALRGFLRYADAVSRGDQVAARAALPRPSVAVTASAPAAPDAPVLEQIAEALRSRGVEVATRVGASTFRCDLALRRPGEAEHRVAVLIDTAERTAAEPLEERLLSHPAALQAAGWQVAEVLTQDWYTRPADVLATLESHLTTAPDPAPAVIQELAVIKEF